jgi:hypothetical protein
MMEAVSTSETSVNLYETKRRNIPEDIHLHTHRRENLKSHIIIALMMEAVSTSETSVNLYETKRRNIPEDIHLHTHRREKLKSRIM